jgi:hypothetical protein
LVGSIVPGCDAEDFNNKQMLREQLAGMKKAQVMDAG